MRGGSCFRLILLPVTSSQALRICMLSNVGAENTDDYLRT